MTQSSNRLRNLTYELPDGIFSFTVEETCGIHDTSFPSFRKRGVDTCKDLYTNVVRRSPSLLELEIYGPRKVRPGSTCCLQVATCCWVRSIVRLRHLVRNESIPFSLKATEVSPVLAEVIDAKTSVEESLYRASSSAYKNDLYLLPEKLDEKVTKFQVFALREKRTVLTQEETFSMGVKVKVPFKSGHHCASVSLSLRRSSSPFVSLFTINFCHWEAFGDIRVSNAPPWRGSLMLLACQLSLGSLIMVGYGYMWDVCGKSGLYWRTWTSGCHSKRTRTSGCHSNATVHRHPHRHARALCCLVSIHRNTHIRPEVAGWAPLV